MIPGTAPHQGPLASSCRTVRVQYRWFASISCGLPKVNYIALYCLKKIVYKRY